MHSHIAGQALVAIGITQFRYGGEVVDESTYLNHCQEVVGVTTTGESILSTPSKDWATFKAKSKMKIGTLGFGYADGFNRLFSNNYKILLGDKKINLVGRVSMDLITIDLTNIKTKKKWELNV